MLLEHLRVLHHVKRGQSSAAASVDASFALDTCQRRLWVGDARGSAFPHGALAGEDAYHLLLRVATGLESAVAGETDVFGQLKQAWRAFAAERSALASELEPWVQKIFEDTKEIRSRHLENLGGVSYGTLVRRALGAKPGEAVSIVGAGKIARSVAPYLTDCELTLWNRTREGAEALGFELRSKGAKAVGLAGSEEALWRRGGHVVVCVPLEAARDAERVSLRSGAPGRVVHLGCLRGQGAATWETLSGFVALDDLFALQNEQSKLRAKALEAAAAACVTRARHRALGGSLSVAHGWEDLAAFQ